MSSHQALKWEMGNPWETINTLVLNNICDKDLKKTAKEEISPVAKSRHQESCIQFRKSARRGSFQFIKKKEKKKGNINNIVLIHLY